MTFTHALATNNYGEAKFIVTADAANGTHTTIAAALTAASSGDTIFIRQGTYTENITLKAGVALVAYPSFGAFGVANAGNVVIIGNTSFTAAGTATLCGLTLQTNSNYALSVTGSAASIVVLQYCYINCTNNTGIQLSSSSSSSAVNLSYCTGNLTTTGIAIFDHSGTGQLRFLHSTFNNGGGSSTNNTVSGGGFFGPNYSGWANGLTLSGTGSSSVGDFIDMTMSGNQTALTTTGTSGFNFQHTTFASNTSSCISIGSGTSGQLHNCLLSSSNANTITGSGTLLFTCITFNSVANLQNTLTLTLGAMNTFISGAGTGTTGQVLTSNGASAPPTWQTSGGGTFVKQARANTSTAGSTATTIPFDDTIPQNTEGAEVLTVAITPANTNNILEIEYNLHMTCVNGNGTSRQFSSAIFQDSTANALYAQLDIQNGADGTNNVGVNVTGRFYMTAGTTSSTTFKLRVGPAGAYTYYWLSNIGSAIFSTVNVATLTVNEYSA